MRTAIRPEPLRQGGFTLLEVLIALVVLGFLMVGLTEGVRAGLSLRQAQTQRLARTADLDVVTRLLRQLLTALPVVPEGARLIASGPDGGSFAGEADRLSFVGRLPTGLGSDRLAEMTLEARNGDLVLFWRPYRHERALAPPPPLERTVLLKDVRRIDLAYWGAPGPNQPVGWQARWKSEQAPDLIRLRLIFGAGDRRHEWPALMVSPQT